MPSLEDIQSARELIAPFILRTPCLESDALSQECGCRVFFKYETLQQTGSFKPRGALNKLLSLEPADRRRGVVAASAGNHAQGVAFAAAKTGIESWIIMPEATPLVKITRTRALGAKVELFGKNLDEALGRARELQERHGYIFVHPFDDEAIIAGQGTAALEALEQVPDLEAVVCPIGGGGLISGVATAVKNLRPEVKVYGVQTQAAPAMKLSYDRGQWTPAQVDATLAEGITLKEPGRITFPIIKEMVDGVELVSEAEIETAVYELLDKAKTLTEGAGAAAYCAVRQGRFPELAGRKVVVFLCGANIDMNVLARIVERSLLKQHRLVRLHITIRDRPGGLAELLRIVADQEANVLHIEHNRVFADNAFWQVDAVLTLETRNQDHIDSLRASLRSAGYDRIEALEVGLGPPDSRT